MCPHCRSLEHTWVPTSGRGTIWSFARAASPAAAGVRRARALQRDHRRARRGSDHPLRRQPRHAPPTAPSTRSTPPPSRSASRCKSPSPRSTTSPSRGGSAPRATTARDRGHVQQRSLAASKNRLRPPGSSARPAVGRKRSSERKEDAHRRRPCNGRRGESTGVTASMRQDRFGPTGWIFGQAARAGSLRPVVPQRLERPLPAELALDPVAGFDDLGANRPLGQLRGGGFAHLGLP